MVKDELWLPKEAQEAEGQADQMADLKKPMAECFTIGSFMLHSFMMGAFSTSY